MDPFYFRFRRNNRFFNLFPLRINIYIAYDWLSKIMLNRTCFIIIPSIKYNRSILICFQNFNFFNNFSTCDIKWICNGSGSFILFIFMCYKMKPFNWIMIILFPITMDILIVFSYHGIYSNRISMSIHRFTINIFKCIFPVCICFYKLSCHFIAMKFKIQVWDRLPRRICKIYFSPK